MSPDDLARPSLGAPRPDDLGRRPATLSRRALLGGAAASLGAATALRPQPAAAAGVRPVVTGTLTHGMDVPWGMAFFSDGRCLIGERDTHRLWILYPNGRRSLQGTLTGVRQPSYQNEGGLLGLALKPGDPSTVFAYITTNTDNRVVKFRLIKGGGVTRPTTVLAGIPTALHHHGGALLFTRSRTLLVTTGDAQVASHAQDVHSLAGKILHITQDGKPAPGNPFGNLVHSYGHRNIEGLSYDANGRLWATEFGNKTTDELNLIVRGGNYGWPAVEGRSSLRGYRNPAATWSPTSTCSPSGLAITRSTAFVGALRGQSLYAVPLSGTSAGTPVRWFHGTYGRIRRVAVAHDGALWVTTSNRDDNGTNPAIGDKVLRVALR